MENDFDPDLKAFLHIVHVSDMHCMDEGAKVDTVTEDKVRLLMHRLRQFGRAKWADHLEQRWQNGLAGHDPFAHERMCVFLKLFAKHPEFGGVETWLLDTGDLSTLGDMPSLRTALAWLDEYRDILGAKQTLILHGNHDAWPGNFPLAANNMELDTHQEALRKLLGKAWPQTAIHTDIPHSGAKLRLSALNSTTGERWPNTLARGVVGMDPPWNQFGDNQLQQLAKQTEQQFHPDGVTRDFRILALHHPVHYPPPRPTLTMSMRNDAEVANALARFSALQRGKLAHLLLSGHTHETYPPRNALPTTSTGQQYIPLYSGQLQLIAGSLSQLPRSAASKAAGDEHFIPQQFQILTFFSSPAYARRRQLHMERRVVGRRSDGPYQFLPLRDPEQAAESVRWEY